MPLRNKGTANKINVYIKLTIMDKFNYDKLESYVMVTLASLASLAISTMLVIHLITRVVGVTSFLVELIFLICSFYMLSIAYKEYKSLNK